MLTTCVRKTIYNEYLCNRQNSRNINFVTLVFNHLKQFWKSCFLINQLFYFMYLYNTVVWNVLVKINICYNFNFSGGTIGCKLCITYQKLWRYQKGTAWLWLLSMMNTAYGLLFLSTLELFLFFINFLFRSKIVILACIT